MNNDFQIHNNQLIKYNGHDTTLTISNVSLIKDRSCSRLDKTETIVVQEGVETIEEYAFANCPNLKKVILPKSVTRIEGCIFFRCPKLEEVEFNAQVAFIPESIFAYCSKLKSIKLPQSVIHIDNRAFMHCTNLQSVTFSEHLLTIGNSSFEGCHNLQEISLPSTVTSLGKKAFYDCHSINKIILPESITKVDESSLETYSELTFISNSHLFIKPMMFDEDWLMPILHNKNSYNFVDSYLPNIDFNKWKDKYKTILLINFLETYDQHSSKESYTNYCLEYKDELVKDMIIKQRFKALNQALDRHIINTDDVEPYFDLIHDREQLAKLLSYQNNNNIDLDSALDDLF